jgi:hypothetical protein
MLALFPWAPQGVAHCLLKQWPNKLTFHKTNVFVVPMTELLYFSSSDLMIEVDYKQTENLLSYFSHRNLSFGERVIVEQYLLTNVAVKTEYYKKHPAVLNYSGIKVTLVKDLNQFHLKNTIKTLKEKEHEADSAVKDLIENSMSQYYFDAIGNKILEIRDVVSTTGSDKTLFEHRRQLGELIEAYNAYSEKKVSYDDVLPQDLMPLLGQPCTQQS